MSEKSGRAFIVRPFGKKSNRKAEEVIDFDQVERELIRPALDRAELSGGTTGEFVQQGNIRADMFRELLVADLVVADISIHNANAFYELGIRHALKGQYTVTIKSSTRGDPHVFDLNSDRYLPYDPDNPASSVDDLYKTIVATLKNENADSPVFELLPGLESFDPAKVIVVPLKFREEVERASSDKEKLQALIPQVTGQWYETEGLRLIGRAQFKLKDHQGSRDTWERIRELDMHDVEANQRLATNYQYLGDYKESELAANRALESPGLTDWEAAETYALIGSNLKTAWLTSLKDHADISEIQRAALTSPFLDDSYEAYRKGFERHRSHYYSGLNAVAMRSMQLELAKRHPDRWVLEFKNEKYADLELEERSEHLAKLVAAADLAIESSIANYPDDEWARISRADLMLLSRPDPDRVKVAYEKCSSIKAFSASSLDKQLGIYRMLGLFEENVAAAAEVIAPLLAASVT